MLTSQMLSTARAEPTYPLYMLALMSEDAVDPMIRASAGYQLKMTVDAAGWAAIATATQDAVKQVLLRLLLHANAYLSRATVAVVASIARSGGLKTWTDLVPALTAALGTEHGVAALRAVDALISDVPDELDDVEIGRPLGVLLPSLVQVAKAASDANVRTTAVACVSKYISTMPPALVECIPAYVDTLMACAARSAPERAAVCEALNLLVEHALSTLAGKESHVMQLMLHTLQDAAQSTEARKHAAAFWGVWANNTAHMAERAPIELLRSVMPEFIPALVSACALSDEEVAEMSWASELASKADRPEDINPAARAAAGADAAGAGEDGAEEDEEDEPEVVEGTVRQTAARCLEGLAAICGDDLLHRLLPLLQQLLEEPVLASSPGGTEEVSSWRRRETGLLVLGTVAEGCYDSMQQHMRGLLPYLLKRAQDPVSYVRATALWVLQQYSPSWPGLAEQQGLASVLRVVLHGITDVTKGVRSAAVTALGYIMESAADDGEPFLPDVIASVTAALPELQTQNRGRCYDTIAAIAETWSEIDPAQFHSAWGMQLVGLLVRTWLQLQPASPEMLSLTECLYVMAGLGGPAIAEVIPQVWARAQYLAELTLTDTATATDLGNAPVHAGLFTATVELMVALLEGTESNGPQLLGWNQPAHAHVVRDILALCDAGMQLPVQACVNISAALCGQLCSDAAALVPEDSWPALVHRLCSVTPANAPCQNALWALDKVLGALGTAGVTYVPEILGAAAPFLQPPPLMHCGLVIRRAAAVLVGACIHHGLPVLVPHAAEILPGWFAYGARVTDHEERIGLHNAMIHIAQHAPDLLQAHIPGVLMLMAAWWDDDEDDAAGPPEEIQAQLAQLLPALAQKAGSAAWQQQLARSSEHSRHVVAHCFPQLLRA